MNDRISLYISLSLFIPSFTNSEGCPVNHSKLEYNPRKILSWAEEDRPREKLMQRGKAALTDAELLAILIGMGTVDYSAVDVGKMVLDAAKGNLNELAKLSLNDLMKVKGIGEAKAITIMAALELGPPPQGIGSASPAAHHECQGRLRRNSPLPARQAARRILDTAPQPRQRGTSPGADQFGRRGRDRGRTPSSFSSTPWNNSPVPSSSSTTTPRATSRPAKPTKTSPEN